MLILVKPYRYVSIIMTTVILFKMLMWKSKSFKAIWVLIHLKIFIFKLPSTTMQWSSHGEKHFSQYVQTVKVTHFIKIGISELSVSHINKQEREKVDLEDQLFPRDPESAPFSYKYFLRWHYPQVLSAAVK